MAAGWPPPEWVRYWCARQFGWTRRQVEEHSLRELMEYMACAKQEREQMEYDGR